MPKHENIHNYWVNTGNKDNESLYELKQSYEYDSLDRLTRENDANTGNTILYEYDAGGNFTVWKYYSYTTDPTSTLGEPEETYGFVYDTAWKDKLKVAGTEHNTV